MLSLPSTIDTPVELKRHLVYESMRVFYDRLVDDADRAWLMEFTQSAVWTHLDEENSLFKHSYDHDGDGKVSQIIIIIIIIKR